jgi:two-component system, LytTR family, response regulator
MTLRILIVDDEPLARERVADLVRHQSPTAELREAGSGETAVTLISAWHPHVVFLDVQMPDGSGLDVVARVGAAEMPCTIFTTAYDEYAVHAFDLAAVDYLLKPFDKERFVRAWSRAMERQTQQAVVEHARQLGALLTGHQTGAAAARTTVPRYIDRVVVKQDQRTVVVMLADVQWMESDGNYVILHAGRDSYQLRDTLTSLESRLDPRRFVRIHRQTIVDMRAMKELQPWFGGDQMMILRDGQRLKVSRNLRAEVARRLAGEW